MESGPESGTLAPMTSDIVHVAIIEDDEEVRLACAEALGRAGMEVSVYASCHAAVDALARGALAPLVVIDLEMPGESAFDTMRTIRACSESTLLIAFTGHGGDEWLFGALVAGCVGYVLKHDASLSIADAVRRAARGGAPMTEGIARRVLERFHAPVEEVPSLSARERSVLAELASGFTYEQTALRLGISLSTVRTHVQHAYAKLGVKTKSEAAARALRLGILS